MVKPFHAGRAAESGVLAAQLARAGFTGSAAAIDGRFGYFSVFETTSTPSPEEFRDALGEPWEVVDPGIVLKRYAACGATHCALDALLELRAELGFAGDDVAEIRCGAEPLALKVLQYSRPVTGLQGKFSMQFCLALAALEGHPRLVHFTDAWATDPRVVALMQRVTVVDRDELGGARNDAVPADVEVVLQDGRRAQRLVTVPVGDPRVPMSVDQRRAKFLDCLYEGMVENGGSVWARLEGLPKANDLGDLLAGLRPSDEGRRASRVAHG